MTRIKEKQIFHTCIPIKVTPLRIRLDQYNPMTVVIDFDYNLIANYFQDKEEIVYVVYRDKEFFKEFTGESVKVQLLTINAVSDIDIFAIPHSGFRYDDELDPTVPGNKIKITFRARDPNIFDVVAHHVQWDNKTGAFITKEMGIIDAVTGDLISADKLKSSRIIDPV